MVNSAYQVSTSAYQVFFVVTCILFISNQYIIIEYRQETCKVEIIIRDVTDIRYSVYSGIFFSIRYSDEYYLQFSTKSNIFKNEIKSNLLKIFIIRYSAENEVEYSVFVQSFVIRIFVASLIIIIILNSHYKRTGCVQRARATELGEKTVHKNVVPSHQTGTVSGSRHLTGLHPTRKSVPSTIQQRQASQNVGKNRTFYQSPKFFDNSPFQNLIRVIIVK